MKAKEHIKGILDMISNPALNWDKLNRLDENDKELLHHLNWFIIFIVLSNPIGIILFERQLLTAPNFTVTIIINSLLKGISLFAGFWGTIYVVREIISPKIEISISYTNALKLVVHAFSLTLAIHLFTSIFPNLFFVKIANIWTLYIVWEGCGKILDIEESKRSNIVLVISCCIVLMPTLINLILQAIFPIAKL